MLSYQNLFDQFNKALSLEWLCIAEKELGRDVEFQDEGRVGFLNLIRPFSIQLIGKTELEFLKELGKNSRSDSLAKLFSDPTKIVVLVDGQRDDELVAQSRHSGVPLLLADAPGEVVFRSFSHFLNRQMASTSVLHGVFMQVKGVGVLLKGESGIGKSELALELISHGHQLIADDAPHFFRSDSGKIYGSSPEVLQDFMEVRGLGVLNIRAMYGDAAIKEREQLKLIVELVPMTSSTRLNSDRLGIEMSVVDVQGADIACTKLLVAPGRNLRVLVEAAVSNFVLNQRGYNALQEFSVRQHMIMSKVDK